MCPTCESHRARTRDTGYDADGRRLRVKVCASCDHRYTTIEVAVPDGVSLYVLDGWRKWRHRMNERTRRGYHGPGLGGPPLKPEPVIDVAVRVRGLA